MLVFVSTGTKSHINYYGGIIESLVKHGHQITMIGPYRVQFEHKNMTQIIMEGTDFSEAFGNIFDLSLLKMMDVFSTHVQKLCMKTMTHPDVVAAMKEDYDAIIQSFVFTECFLSYVHEKKVPLIYMAVNSMTTPYSEKLGAPEFPSVSPYMVMPWINPLSFMERVVTALISSAIYFGTALRTDPGLDKLYRDTNLWGPDIPPLSELHTMASLAIVNSVRALEAPIKSVPPTIIYAGGIHIQETKPLPQDLEDWLAGSGEEGCILFSLGSYVKPSDMKDEHLQAILNVFRSLKQRIIWKWDSQTIEDLPPNVKLSTWLPQTDILAHPKTRLLITHGGLLSTQEATYFSVPILGMPIIVDQINNVARVVHEGWGSRVLWSELDEEKFRTAILETITNNSFRKTVAHRSRLMKDWPTKPSEEVNYWVEYVIRHNGAKHLQSPLVHLPWYQIYNIDVWAFIISVVVTILIILFLIVRSCLRMCYRKCFKRKRD